MLRASKQTVLKLSVPCLLSLVLCASWPGTTVGADWTRFRGPNGTGESSDPEIPLEIGESENLVWKVELPGGGNSCPITSHGKIFLQTASSDGANRSLLCLDLATGKKLWSRDVAGTMAKTHNKNSLASCSAAVDDERVYMPFWDGQNLSVLAFSHEGEPVWTAPLGSFTSQHGPGHSPIITAGKVIIANDQDGLAELIALDAKTGKLAWKKPRHPFRASYSTPILFSRNGKSDEVIAASTQGVTGYNPADGTELWNWDWKSNSQELRTVGSPIVCQEHVFFTGGNGPGARHAVAVNLSGKQGAAPVFAWETQKDFPYVPCMLSRGDNLYFVNDAGIAGCYEAKTGRNLWLKRLNGGDVTASPVMIENRVYAFTETGGVFVFAADPQFNLLYSGKLDEGVKSSPAVADGRLLVRGNKSLYCFGKKGEKGSGK